MAALAMRRRRIAAKCGERSCTPIERAPIGGAPKQWAKARSASVGALAFLWVFGFDLTVIAIIGLIMLIGIVKKNAIMMIDFALERRRQEQKSAEQAILEAAELRFRPIMMTTMAAIFGVLPIA